MRGLGRRAARSDHDARARLSDPRAAHMRLILASAVALVILALALDLIVGRLG
jgi:hypothetical protein